MPNKRAADQTLIAFALKGELLRGVDTVRSKTGQNRSDFIRSAIMEELARRGVIVQIDAALAPDRTRKARYPEQAPTTARMNDGVPSPARSVADQGASNLLHRNVPTPDPELQRRAAKTQRRKGEK